MFAFPSALSGSGSAFWRVVLLLARLGREYAAASRAFLEFGLRGYEGSDVGIRTGYQVGRVVGKLDFSGLTSH